MNDVDVIVHFNNLLTCTVAAAAIAGGVHFLFINDLVGHRRKSFL